MNQLNKKESIQHYLLNILTVLNVELSNLNISQKEKRKINDLINIASLLISNEKIFLNIKPEFYIQNISLKELVDITCNIFDQEITEKNIKIIPLTEDYVIKVDKYYFGEAFKYILKEIISDSNRIEFKFDKKRKKFHILHNKKTKTNNSPNEISMILKNKHITKQDIAFKLACEILKMLNINLSCETSNTEMTF